MNGPPPSSGHIPQSNALREAGSGAEALAELSRRAAEIMSISPELLSDVELDTMIGALIEHRRRLEAGATAPRKRAATATTKPKIIIDGTKTGL